MSISRLGNTRRRNKKDDPENPGLRFLYSEAVAKVLRKYDPCVELVGKRYPSSYLYRDNTDLSLIHLPRLGEHYEEIAIVRSPPEVAKRPTCLPDHVASGRKRTTFFLPDINPRERLSPKGGVHVVESRTSTAPMTPSSIYHRHCFERTESQHGYSFLTERRSAYASRRLPSALGAPMPYTFSNRPILEKLWTERIPQYREGNT
jgi:hypothetical protein